jgi:hypothetical protein
MLQRFTRMMLALAAAVGIMSARPALAWAQVEAVTGQPFGVAEVTVAFPPADVGAAVGSSTFTVSSPDGRVFYPAFNRGFLIRVLGDSAPPPGQLNVMFLFQGDAPFDVTIRTPTAQTVHVAPRSRNPAAFHRVMGRWWRYYIAFLREQFIDSDYPPVAETYLSSMLARRLNLPETLVQRLTADSSKSHGRQTLELLSGAEAMRMDVLKNSSLGLHLDTQSATLPLPDPVAWRRVSLDTQHADVTVEPMAMRVPPECFYVRFGQYSNYLWLNALLQDYGGEIGSMISSRGLRTGVSERVQDQLALEQGVLAELLGPQAIADVAMIGMDTFTREGAAIGAIFQATGNLLGADLVRQRQEALFREKDNGSTLSTVQIAGRDVSFLSTPDNRLRSFYVIDGPYHLVANSRRIVERFLEVREGTGALGASAEFRQARRSVPTSRDDTIFVYFSSAFFENLLSPPYQIELHRRLQAATDLEQITLAQLAARCERKPGDTLDKLVDAQLLPRGTGARPDGGAPVIADTRVFDSLRGARGFFIPVPDLPVDKVSPAEHERYTAQRTYYEQNWQQMDPLLVALKRYALDSEGRERITIDAFISPLDDTKYDWLLSSLGEPTKYQLVPPTDNIVSVEAAVRGGLLFPGIPAHTLFLGIQDHEPLARYTPDNVLRFLRIARTVPGFLGAWPKPGFLDVLPLSLAGAPDAQGFSQLLLGIWRWQGRGFSMLSMDRTLLQDVSEQVGFVEVDDPAQIRVRVGDLSTAKFGDWLDAMGYERARQVSVGNAQFLGILTQQLGVPPESALDIAQQLLDAQLVCPLGGTYQRTEQGEFAAWQSTAWPAARRDEVPAAYVTPPLDWFRGLDARVVRYPNQLVVHAYMDMQRKDREPVIDLPLFDLFGKKKQDAAEDPADE